MSLWNRALLLSLFSLKFRLTLARETGEIKKGVEDLSPGIFDFAAQPFWAREKRFNELPLQVAQVGRIRFSRLHTC